MYRVILVDDERLIIRGLSSVVPWAELGCEVAGVAYDGNTGLELIRQMEPDIVLTEAEGAMQAIGELTGQTVREDVTERIFARFCVGK